MPRGSEKCRRGRSIPGVREAIKVFLIKKPEEKMWIEKTPARVIPRGKAGGEKA